MLRKILALNFLVILFAASANATVTWYTKNEIPNNLQTEQTLQGTADCGLSTTAIQSMNNCNEPLEEANALGSTFATSTSTTAPIAAAAAVAK